MLHGILRAILLCCFISMGGCAGPQIGVAPPCASIEYPAPGDPPRVYRGQGMLVGNRLLTAGHTFVQDGTAFPPNVLRVNGQLTWVRSSSHGDVETIRTLYGKGASLNPSDFLEDWVAFEVEESAARSPSPWFLGEGRTTPGETLHAVRLDVSTGKPRLEGVPLKVVEVESEQSLPKGLIFVTNPLKESLKGWSGCFVGRFDKRRALWEFCGILISTSETEGGYPALHMVLRPPARVLEWPVGS